LIREKVVNVGNNFQLFRWMCLFRSLATMADTSATNSPQANFFALQAVPQEKPSMLSDIPMIAGVLLWDEAEKLSPNLDITPTIEGVAALLDKAAFETIGSLVERRIKSSGSETREWLRSYGMVNGIPLSVPDWVEKLGVSNSGQARSVKERCDPTVACMFYLRSISPHFACFPTQTSKLNRAFWDVPPHVGTRRMYECLGYLCRFSPPEAAAILAAYGWQPAVLKIFGTPTGKITPTHQDVMKVINANEGRFAALGYFADEVGREVNWSRKDIEVLLAAASILGGAEIADVSSAGPDTFYCLGLCYATCVRAGAPFERCEAEKMLEDSPTKANRYAAQIDTGKSATISGPKLEIEWKGVSSDVGLIDTLAQPEEGNLRRRLPILKAFRAPGRMQTGYEPGTFHIDDAIRFGCEEVEPVAMYRCLGIMGFLGLEGEQAVSACRICGWDDEIAAKVCRPDASACLSDTPSSEARGILHYYFAATDVDRVSAAIWN
jgi:hypothetical protein